MPFISEVRRGKWWAQTVSAAAFGSRETEKVIISFALLGGGKRARHRSPWLQIVITPELASGAGRRFQTPQKGSENFWKSEPACQGVFARQRGRVLGRVIIFRPREIHFKLGHIILLLLADRICSQHA